MAARSKPRHARSLPRLRYVAIRCALHDMLALSLVQPLQHSEDRSPAHLLGALACPPPLILISPLPTHCTSTSHLSLRGLIRPTLPACFITRPHARELTGYQPCCSRSFKPRAVGAPSRGPPESRLSELSPFLSGDGLSLSITLDSDPMRVGSRARSASILAPIRWAPNGSEENLTSVAIRLSPKPQVAQRSTSPSRERGSSASRPCGNRTGSRRVPSGPPGSNEVKSLEPDKPMQGHHRSGGGRFSQTRSRPEEGGEETR